MDLRVRAFVMLVTCIGFVNSAMAYTLILHSKTVTVEAGALHQFPVEAHNCSVVAGEEDISNVTLRVVSSDVRVADCESCLFQVPCEANGSVRIRAIAIGLAKLQLEAENGSPLEIVEVAVTRQKATIVDSVFTYGLIAIMSLGTMGFGASLDMTVVKERLRRPKALAVGLACQFTLMPTIALALAKMISLPVPLALGVFATGCAPSGGASNVWTKLLGGDVDQSIVLTFLANILAFGTMPFWLYTAGGVVAEEITIVIPYVDMLQALAVSLVPLIVGILAKRFLPKLGAVMVKAITPLSIIFILYVTTLGVYANVYIFDVINREPRVWIVVLLPFTGLALAGLAALAFRESRASCIAIAVETSIQNTGTAIILLRLSLQQPWSDMSLCVPILVSMFTPLPLIVALGAKRARAKLRERLKKSETAEPEGALTESIGGGLETVKGGALDSTLLRCLESEGIVKEERSPAGTKAAGRLSCVSCHETSV